MTESGNVVIIGAGPAGSIAGALLSRQGHRVTVVERDAFPRFCIGESLLPQCMEFIAEAGMLEAVQAAGFQLKTGAAFLHHDKYSEFCFADKFTPGFDTTFQVQRARFDALLAEQAQASGVKIRWRHQVVAADFSAEPVLTVNDENGEPYTLNADFVLDASGYGRVLPRLLELDKPSDFPFRQALFTHLEDRIDDPGYDRNLIRIIVHPQLDDVWFWLIPFSNGRCSLGVVGKPELFARPGLDNEALLQRLIGEEPGLSALLHNAVFDTPVSTLAGYSANVKTLYGNGFALLGNAGEFLDPVFSSGVTIAMKSASLAAAVLDRRFRGESVDWQREFAEPLQQGVETFRTFVGAWYDGGFQDVVFYPHLKQAEQKNNIKQMICSILAGYVWDDSNPYVKNHRLRLKTLVELCREPEWR